MERSKQRLKALGKIRHRKFTQLKATKKSAVIEQLCDYVSRTGKRVLTEKRRLTFRVVGDTRTIDFDQELIASDGDARFEDKKDSGLSIRVPTSMDVTSDPAGTIINSAGDRDKDAWSKAGKWCDYNGPVAGEHLGVAILNHPSSFRHVTRWHVRTYGLVHRQSLRLPTVQQERPGQFIHPQGRRPPQTPPPLHLSSRR